MGLLRGADQGSMRQSGRVAAGGVRAGGLKPAWRRNNASDLLNTDFREVLMSVIKAVDLAYGRLRSPDLDKQEEFLTDFGMVRADRTKTALYMRGTDAPHHLHVTELGEPRYVGVAVHAASLDDLQRISRADGASPIEDIEEPGGGKRVRLT